MSKEGIWRRVNANKIQGRMILSKEDYEDPDFARKTWVVAVVMSIQALCFVLRRAAMCLLFSKMLACGMFLYAMVDTIKDLVEDFREMQDAADLFCAKIGMSLLTIFAGGYGMGTILFVEKRVEITAEGCVGIVSLVYMFLAANKMVRLPTAGDTYRAGFLVGAAVLVLAVAAAKPDVVCKLIPYLLTGGGFVMACASMAMKHLWMEEIDVDWNGYGIVKTMAFIMAMCGALAIDELPFVQFSNVVT